MARTNAQQWLQKWGTNLNGAGTYITNGVKAVTQAPGQAAAAQQQRYIQGVTQNANKWASNVAAVPLATWQNAMINKGIPRLAQGITQAQQTKVQSVTTLLNNVDQATAAANQLPKGGLQQGIARATAFMTTMSQLSQASKGNQ